MFKYPSLFIFLLIFILACTPRRPEQTSQSSTEDIPNTINEIPEPVPKKKEKKSLASPASQSQQEGSAVAVSRNPKTGEGSLNPIQPADSPSASDESGTIDDLWQAVGDNNKKEVKRLLKIPAIKNNINNKSTVTIGDYLDERTVLHYAIYYIVWVDPNYLTPDAQKHRVEIADMLLKKGADPLIPNKTGETPLRFAIGHRNISAIQMMFKNTGF